MRVRPWTEKTAYVCRVQFDLSLNEVCCCCIIAVCSGWFGDRVGADIVPSTVSDVDRRTRLVVLEIGRRSLVGMAAGYGLDRVAWRAVRSAVVSLFDDERWIGGTQKYGQV